jgi:hypothetical protein
MVRHSGSALWTGPVLVGLAVPGCHSSKPEASAPAEALALALATLPRIGKIDEGLSPKRGGIGCASSTWAYFFLVPTLSTFLGIGRYAAVGGPA